MHVFTSTDHGQHRLVRWIQEGALFTQNMHASWSSPELEAWQSTCDEGAGGAGHCGHEHASQHGGQPQRCALGERLKRPRPRLIARQAHPGDC